MTHLGGVGVALELSLETTAWDVRKIIKIVRFFQAGAGEPPPLDYDRAHE
jgi:hypothetical protein